MVRPIEGLKAMSAIGYSAPRRRDFHVSAAADWRHEQLVFARQQSLATRQMPWENRAKPLRSWGSLVATWASAAVLALTMLAVLV